MTAMGDCVIRLAALGLSHEANTFAPQVVDLATFEATGVLRGDEIVARHANGASTMSGFLAVGADPGIEVVPLMMTNLWAGGPITADALEVQANELVRALTEHGPFDGVLAALHGAAVAEHVLDVDGYLLRRFREVVGPSVPIGVSLDLHANISVEMVSQSDVLNTYRTNPHVDANEVAEEVARLILRSVRGEIRPTQAFEPVPAVLNILCQNTATPPMSDIMAEVRALMAEPGVLSATVAEGFPYADVPEMGMAVVVVTDGEPTAAVRHARALAEQVWARREHFQASALTAAEALRRADEAARGPVLLLDIGDNIGGGTPGDSVSLLGAARELGFESLLAIVADPLAVAECDRAGVGGATELRIGAKSSAEVGPPIQAQAAVLALHDGMFEATGAVHAGMRHFDGGRTAAVQLDTGQTVILTSKVVAPLSILQLTTLGLHPADFKAIVAKGVHSPLAGYGPHVAEVIPVDTPGITSADLNRFTYRHRRRPLYPFERETNYPGEQEHLKAAALYNEGE